MLFPSKWTCSDNSWNLRRFSCSSPGALTMEQLEDLLSSSNADTSRNIKAAKKDVDSLETSEGLDALANLAIREDGEVLPPSAQATTRHPRHRPGCTCIVCIQPPSGKGPKHKDTCTCSVCLTVRRRFRTLMARREKRETGKEPESVSRRSGKEAESGRKKQKNIRPPEKQEYDMRANGNNSCGNSKRTANENADDDIKSKKSSPSPFIGGIDLNIQPEREDEPSDSFSMSRSEQGGQEVDHRQVMIASADGHIEVVVRPEPRAEDGSDVADGEKLDTSVPFAKGHLDANGDQHV